MTREHLAEAATSIQSASDAADDDETIERLRNQSEQFSTLADADRGPDHGKLARHEHVLTEIADGESSDVASHVERALESIHAYRETLEGV
ncbi:hypothetical protein EA462_09235 [Natrarchaeobius halalkaliphilus]|uniref:Uncharacterized protein n=1 Tax=Natrarchaeobius halalkaliphilus TaxID=1679091 RepID=A0A3N6M4K0_9EURY|nr:hypothetical protein [Natrarchaeobius halalkaliphilus]RQG90161.1 hypothetical protein EA462_09235 [Natrarchaeobius halalkaliphilus]